MKIRNIIIVIILLFTVNSFSQNQTNDNFEELPLKIRSAFNPNTHYIDNIDSIKTETLTREKSMQLFRIQSNSTKLFTIKFHIGPYTDSVLIYKTDNDTNYYINEYSYFKLLGSYYINSKNCLDSNYIKKEIEKRGRGISQVEFKTIYEGTYFDQLLGTDKIEFFINPQLFRHSNGVELDRISNYLNFVPIENAKSKFKEDYYSTYICFRGESVLQKKDGEIDLELSQFRRCLLNSNSGKLISDNIIGEYIHLIKCKL